MSLFNLLSCMGARTKDDKNLSEKTPLLTAEVSGPPMAPIHILTLPQTAAIDAICAAIITHQTGFLASTAVKSCIIKNVAVCGGWSTWLAENIYNRLVAFIQDEKNRSIAGEAFNEAWNKAFEEAMRIEGWCKEHPLYASAIAAVVVLGILMILSPWVLEVLGFGALGPVEGSWAAAWQSLYGGAVEAGSFFSYLQRLGMVGIGLSRL